MMAIYSFVNGPDAAQKPMLHSGNIPSEKNSWSGQNRPGWKNKQVDEWLDQSEAEFDPAKRVELLRKVMKL